MIDKICYKIFGGLDRICEWVANKLAGPRCKCKKEFEAKEEFDMFCGDECKQEALADLDKDSDECLSCQ